MVCREAYTIPNFQNGKSGFWLHTSKYIVVEENELYVSHNYENTIPQPGYDELDGNIERIASPLQFTEFFSTVLLSTDRLGSCAD